MPPIRDLTGKVFGTFTVLSLESVKRRARWHVLCSCGTEKVIYGYQLTSGQVRSCGCVRAKVIAKINAIRLAKMDAVRPTYLPACPHRSPEYKVWANMKIRCTNQNWPRFAHYGGRGITICLRWKNSFRNFYADMGPRPTPDLSIDRIDNGQGYFPGNVRWATGKQQIANQRPRKTRA